MQAKAKYYELRVFMSLRPSNYLAGRLLKFFGARIYIPKIGYVINDVKLARSIMKDSANFSTAEAGGIGALLLQIDEKPSLLSMEGGEHHKFKYALLDLFSDQSLKKLIGRDLKSIALDIVKRINDGEEVDVAEYVRYCTNRITSRILGVYETDEETLLELGEVITNFMGCIDLKHHKLTDKNLRRAKDFSRQLIATAKKYYESPDTKEDSIIKRLKKMGYEFDDAKSFIIMFLIAGTVTVSSSLPRIVALLLDTDAFDMLKGDPKLLDSAINEGLRFITPGPVVLHGVSKTNDNSGYSFKAGRRVVILMYNIMHDRRYTTNASRFDIKREQNNEIENFWFGAGIHFCMGSVLARMEIETFLKSLLSVKGSIKITKRVYRRNGIYPGYKKLEVQLENS